MKSSVLLAPLWDCPNQPECLSLQAYRQGLPSWAEAMKPLVECATWLPSKSSIHLCKTMRHNNMHLQYSAGERTETCHDADGTAVG